MSVGLAAGGPPSRRVVEGFEDRVDHKRKWLRHIGPFGRGDDTLEPEVLAQLGERASAKVGVSYGYQAARRGESASGPAF